MSQPIQNYPVSYPYAATDPPYSASHPHKGVDLNIIREDVKVGDTVIGVSGNTGSYLGQTYAYHCHVQAGTDAWAQNTVNPVPYLGQPGTVVKTGWASEWGNYVTILVNGVYVYYCHLSSINVTVGTVIHQEDSMAIIQNADNWRGRMGKVMQRERGRDLSEAEFTQWIGQDFLHYVEAVEDNPESDSWYNNAVVGRNALSQNWQQQITDLTSRTSDMQNTISNLQSELASAQAQVISLTPQPIAEVTAPAEQTEQVTPQKTKTSRASLVVKVIAGLLSIRKKKV